MADSCAARANALARTACRRPGRRQRRNLAHPVEANEVFVHLPDETAARLRKAGAVFYDWEPPEEGRTLIRLVTSFATPAEDVANFIRIAKG